MEQDAALEDTAPAEPKKTKKKKKKASIPGTIPLLVRPPAHRTSTPCSPGRLLHDTALK